jgi:ribonuclease G
MDPKHQIIINRAFGESRVAILYGTRVERLLIERDQDRDILGNIYVGKIKRVLPGMQSAFVEIGLDRTAFLFGRDARDPDSMEDDFDWEDDDNNRARQGNQKIENLVKEGQEIIVQVGKEPLGTKGARITMRISLPGRFVVLVPFTRTIGVSKRIQDDSERSRLREILQSIDLESEQIGYIVRTAAEGQPAEHLRKDAEFLLDLWKSTKKRIPKAKSPEVIYENLPLHERVIREHYHVDTDTIMIDDPEAYKEIKKFLQRAIPGAAEKLQLYKDILPIFDAYGIERDLEKAISSRIDLPSGGYLVIDHTEALTRHHISDKYGGRRKNCRTDSHPQFRWHHRS